MYCNYFHWLSPFVFADKCHHAPGLGHIELAGVGVALHHTETCEEIRRGGWPSVTIYWCHTVDLPIRELIYSESANECWFWRILLLHLPLYVSEQTAAALQSRRNCRNSSRIERKKVNGFGEKCQFVLQLQSTLWEKSGKLWTQSLAATMETVKTNKEEGQRLFI